MYDDLLLSSGTLRYSRTETGGYRLVLELDRDFARYYRWLMPRYVDGILPMHNPHVTVVRAEKETPVNLEPWGKYEGEVVNFIYSPIVHTGTVYFWLNVFCKRLEEIRAELGLSIRSQYTITPEGFTKCFHTTIANKKFSQTRPIHGSSG